MAKLYLPKSTNYAQVKAKSNFGGSERSSSAHGNCQTLPAAVGVQCKRLQSVNYASATNKSAALTLQTAIYTRLCTAYIHASTHPHILPHNTKNAHRVASRYVAWH